jgi:hypothetical protein
MKWLKVSVVILTTFVIIAGGALGTSIVALKGAMPDRVVFLLCGLLGAVAAAKELRALFALPPINENSSSAVSDLIKNEK